MPLRCEAILMFNLADQLPGGDLILEALAITSSSQKSDCADVSTAASGMYSISVLARMSSLGGGGGGGGAVIGAESKVVNEVGLLVGEIVVGEMSALERAVVNSRNSFKKVELAQAAVNGAKVEGIDTNLAVMKELLLPIMKIVKLLLFFASWDDPLNSLVFCLATAYIICRGWIGHVFALLTLSIAIFMLLTRCCSQGMLDNELRVIAPTEMNTVEQLLAVQNAISQVEELVQDGNIVLFKLRAFLLAVSPQATERVALALVLVALILAFLPLKYVGLLMFLDVFTRYSPPRKASTERWTRRLREWWFSIPAAPVVLEIIKEDKKNR
ncbi:hypothetical protein MRB53_023998 [Persea americana]|uniref:Uncharacterized protein n=1 Tax=Persea americana TaxID=3435 RepID=A0ACC2LB51_PERAE|nr:hypothetical protein MRB53_023998 [Persea americana]